MSNARGGTLQQPTSESSDPRVVRSREAILRATADLLVEQGYAGVTIEGIAERAGVAKTTVYRHWSSRSQLIFDAFESMLLPATNRVPPGDLREQLVVMLEGLIRGVTVSTWAPAISAMVEAGDREVEVRMLLQGFLAQRMEPVRGVLRRAISEEVLRPDLDVEAAVGALAGPVFYRRLISREPLGDGYAEVVVDQFLGGARA